MILRNCKEFLATLLLAVLLVQCQANREPPPFESKLINDVAKWYPTQECQDNTGRMVKHSMHFVPQGIDNCKMCVCDNGKAKSCRNVLCTPPPDCKSFQLGPACCEFICLDEKNTAGSISRSIITYLLVAIGLLLLILICLCRVHRFKKDLVANWCKEDMFVNLCKKENLFSWFKCPFKCPDVPGYLETQRLRRTQQEAKIACANESPQTVQMSTEPQSDLILPKSPSEDPYFKMSAELIAKSVEVERLKKRVRDLENQLDMLEAERECDAPDWKNLYDLQVEINADSSK